MAKKKTDNPADRLKEPCGITKDEAFEFFCAYYEEQQGQEFPISECWSAFQERNPGVKVSVDSFRAWARDHDWFTRARMRAANLILAELRPLVPIMADDALTGLQGKFIEKIRVALDGLAIEGVHQLPTLLECVVTLTEIRQTGGMPVAGNDSGGGRANSIDERMEQLRKKVTQLHAAGHK